MIPVACSCAPNHTNGGRVVLVAPDTTGRSTLCETLTEQGHQVSGCTTVQEVMTAIQHNTFDLVLVDSLIPEMVDLDMLKRLEVIDPLIMVIVMVRNGSAQVGPVRCQNGAVFAHLLGPFQPGVHLTLVNHAIEISRLRRLNAELYQKLRAHELSRMLLVPENSETLLHNLADAMVRAFEVDELSIMLLTETGQELRVAVVRGNNRDHLLGVQMPISQGIAGWVARHRKSITLHGEVNGTDFNPIRRRSDIRCSVLIPISRSADLMGILCLNAIRRPPFTIRDVEAMDILVSAAEAGLARAKPRPRASR